mgnify:CR=1 FL=1
MVRVYLPENAGKMSLCVMDLTQLLDYLNEHEQQHYLFVSSTKDDDCAEEWFEAANHSDNEGFMRVYKPTKHVIGSIVAGREDHVIFVISKTSKLEWISDDEEEKEKEEEVKKEEGLASAVEEA